MANTFSNTGGWKQHTTVFNPDPVDASWPTYTYYFAAQDDVTGEVTATQSVTYTADNSWPGTIARNCNAITLSDTKIKVQFQDPTNTTDTTGYRIYRNGTLIMSTSQFGWPGIIDSGLSPDTIYNYSATVELSGVEQPQCPAFPARTLPAGTRCSVSSSVPKLEDFESGLNAINPSNTDDWTKYLFNNYPFADLQGDMYSDAVISTSTTFAKDGTHSFKAHMTGTLPGSYTIKGSVYFAMRPIDDTLNAWHFARDYMTSGSWAFNTFNRLRIWVRTPSTWPTQTGGHENVQFGTYVRSSHGALGGASADESGYGGNHFYHHFNIPHTDSWYQVIVDTHPSHQRQAPGSVEWHDHAHFSGQPAWNYMDALGNWYFDSTVTHPALTFPCDFYFDDIEYFSEDETLMNMETVYAVHGGFDVGSSTVYVGWSHPKDDDTTKADVVYAFSDLYASGFASGTTFPGTSGGVTPLSSVYNCQLVSSNSITLGVNTVIYVGIRQQGDTGFRQIAIPLS
jgi:hypothetical protein